MTLAALAADIARAHLARQSPAPAGEEDAPEVVSAIKALL